MEAVGRVSEMWRYPVKSLVGESLTAATVDARGMRGDRLWSVRDAEGKFGSGKTTRRFRRIDGLLALAAVYDEDDVPAIVFPDGRRIRGDDAALGRALSDQLGLPVTLGREADVSHFDEGPLHVLTTASVAAVEAAGGVRRFRPNIVVDTGTLTGLVEDGWIGRRLSLGDDVRIELRTGMTRCVMVELPQVGVGPERGLLERIVALNDNRLGVVADVVRGGVVSVGDDVRLLAD